MKRIFQKTSLSNLAISKASKVGGYLIKYKLGNLGTKELNITYQIFDGSSRDFSRRRNVGQSRGCI
jgi:hypothetical protein